MSPSGSRPLGVPVIGVGLSPQVPLAWMDDQSLAHLRAAALPAEVRLAPRMEAALEDPAVLAAQRVTEAATASSISGNAVDLA